MLINHDKPPKNKDIAIITVQKWKILVDLFLSRLIVEKMIAKRNNKTWILRLGSVMKLGIMPSWKRVSLRRLRVPSIISKIDPIIINSKGANDIKNLNVYINFILRCLAWKWIWSFLIFWGENIFCPLS